MLGSGLPEHGVRGEGAHAYVDRFATNKTYQPTANQKPTTYFFGPGTLPTAKPKTYPTLFLPGNREGKTRFKHMDQEKRVTKLLRLDQNEYLKLENTIPDDDNVFRKVIH